MTIERFEQLCSNYDTYYEMSDDVNVWRRGNRMDSDIRIAYRELCQLKQGDKADEILNKYYHKMISAPGCNLARQLLPEWK